MTQSIFAAVRHFPGDSLNANHFVMMFIW